MWTLYDMASGEIIGISAEAPRAVGRPLPLYAPGAAPALCPLSVAGTGEHRRLPREVVLTTDLAPPWPED